MNGTLPPNGPPLVNWNRAVIRYKKVNFQGRSERSCWRFPGSIKETSHQNAKSSIACSPLQHFCNKAKTIQARFVVDESALCDRVFFGMVFLFVREEVEGHTCCFAEIPAQKHTLVTPNLRGGIWMS